MVICVLHCYNYINAVYGDISGVIIINIQKY